jgi:hypothetical protein
MERKGGNKKCRILTITKLQGGRRVRERQSRNGSQCKGSNTITIFIIG